MPNVKVRKLRNVATEELPIKRFYAPYVIESNCPTCGKLADRDLSSNYIMYPTLGEPIEILMYCYDDDGDESLYCDEWAIQVQLDIKVKAIPQCND